MISIKIRQLTKRFGAIVALRGIDLAIEPGELFFLLGPSGCGKTTLLRSLAGFYVPEEGRFFFDEEDVTRLASHKRNTDMVLSFVAASSACLRLHCAKLLLRATKKHRGFFPAISARIF